MKLDLSSIHRMNGASVNPVSEKIRNLPLFSWIDASFIDLLVSECPMESYSNGAIILLEGAESNGKAYIILSGEVEVSIGQNIVSKLSEGMLFGEYALICQDKRSATIRAIRETQCLVMEESHLLAMADGTGEINNMIIQRIEENAKEKRGGFGL